MIVAQQIRAARSLIGIGQAELAKEADIAVATLRRMENDAIGPERSQAGGVERVRKTLEERGVQFIPENGGGPGVRLRDRK